MLNLLKFEKIVSLGHFCSIAIELNEFGIREESYPFDWVISDFQSIIELINNDFKGFIKLSHLFQDKNKRNYYYCDLSKIWFYHDFYEKIPPAFNFLNVKRKYKRRIKRFKNLNKNTTLFIRYCADQNEINWIKANETLIKNIFPNLIFISNIYFESAFPVFVVSPLDDDDFCKKPLHSNAILNESFKMISKKKGDVPKSKRFGIIFYKKYISLLHKIFKKVHIHRKTI